MYWIYLALVFTLNQVSQKLKCLSSISVHLRRIFTYWPNYFICYNRGLGPLEKSKKYYWKYFFKVFFYINRQFCQWSKNSKNKVDSKIVMNQGQWWISLWHLLTVLTWQLVFCGTSCKSVLQNYVLWQVKDLLSFMHVKKKDTDKRFLPVKAGISLVALWRLQQTVQFYHQWLHSWF